MNIFKDTLKYKISFNDKRNDETPAINVLFTDEGNKFSGDDILEKYFESIDKLEHHRIMRDGKFCDYIFVDLNELEGDKLRKAGGKLAKTVLGLMKKYKTEPTVAIYLENMPQNERAAIFVEGLVLGSYKFDKYITPDEDDVVRGEYILSTSIKDICYESLIKVGYALKARNLVNEPSNVIYPQTLSVAAVEMCEDNDIDIDVMLTDKIQELNMEAFLAVARGSSNAPRFLVMKYMGDSDSDEVLGLVGKGITMDTGGYSLKPPKSMINMKNDMAGAASVICAINAIAELKIKTNVVAVCALCENSVSGNAYKPGDIIGSMSKKTIEVLNTDAEGRLTLADACYYCATIGGATKIIDVCTLTGAALVISSDVATPVVTNNEDFYKKLVAASEVSGEKFFNLPVFEEYKEFIKGSEADLANVSSSNAGCVTAGMFVGEFVNDLPWLHLDIAGTAMHSKAEGYYSKGATAHPVRTLIELAKDFK